MPHRCIKPLCDSMGCVMCNCAVPETVKPTSTPRVTKMRQARRKLGLKRRDLEAHPDDWPAIREFAAELQRRRVEQAK